MGRVAVFNGADRPITIERVPDPAPAPDGLIVRIGRCGICGSDISMTAGGPFQFPTGCHLGHEYAGEVVEIGADVGDVKVGDTVACVPCFGCGECAECSAGRYFYCASRGPLFGGFGDYVAVPRRNAIVLPRSLSLADGALVEPIACGLHSLTMAGFRKGDRVLVLGAGSTASAIIYWARLLGAGRIVVLTRSDRRRELVMSMGADALLVSAETEAKQIEEALGGPADIVAECVGKPGMLNQAIEAVRPNGTIVSLGMCTMAEPVLPALCAFKELKLVFPRGYTVFEFADTAKAFDAGRFVPETMVDEVIPLEALPAAFDRLRAGSSAKIHVDPRLEPARV